MKINYTLKKHFTDFIYKGGSDSILYPFSPLFSLISHIFAGILRIRFLLYRVGALNTKRLNIRVISVGNITLGGTGKTPTVEMIAGTLNSKNIKTAILSRGYKGKSSGMVNVVSDFDSMLMTPDESGDEPYMLAKRLKGAAPVITGRDRYITGVYAKEKFGVDAVILDDGFQHIKLERDINILLVDSQTLFGNEYLFPRGILREPLINLERADVVLLTKCKKPFDVPHFKEKYITRSIPVFTSRFIATECVEIFSREKKSPGYLKGKKVAAFCAIASPESFRTMIKDLGAEITGFLEYPDHHSFTEDDLACIERQGCLNKADIFITTEKDSVKLLSCHSFSRPIWALQIAMEIIDKTEEWENILLKSFQ